MTPKCLALACFARGFSDGGVVISSAKAFANIAKPKMRLIASDSAPALFGFNEKRVEQCMALRVLSAGAAKWTSFLSQEKALLLFMRYLLE